MEKRRILILLVCLASVFSVLSVLACVRGLAFNEAFVAYEQALAAYRAHGAPYPQLLNVTYYSVGLTRNRTDLLLGNIGNAQFEVSSVRWRPSEQMWGTDRILTPEEYSMNPSSGIIQPNGTLLIIVKWGVLGGNMTENEWSLNESYYWQIGNPRNYNFGAMVKPGDDLSQQVAEQATSYRKSQAESEIMSQADYTYLLVQKWVITSEMWVSLCSFVVTTFASFYVATRFNLRARMIFDNQVTAIVSWIVLSPSVVFIGSVIFNVVQRGIPAMPGEDLWSAYLRMWLWTLVGGMEPYFLGWWIVGCAWGALFIYLVFNYGRRSSVPYYRSLSISLLSLTFLISAFTVTLPLTNSVVPTFVQVSEAALMAIVAACLAIPGSIRRNVRMRFGGVRERWKSKVKLTASDFAIIIGCIALLISVGYPLANYFVAAGPSGEPVLSVPSLYVSAYYTHVELSNTGNAASHNVRLEIVYEGHGLPPLGNVRATQFVPQLDEGDTVELDIPIGRSVLREQTSDLSRFTAVIRFESDETPAQSFDFHPFLTIPLST